MKYEKVFVPVSVDERLPDDKINSHFILYQSIQTKGTLNISSFKKWNVTHWLEEKQDVYVMSEEELKDFAQEIYDIGYNQSSFSHDSSLLEHGQPETLEDFLNSKLQHHDAGRKSK